MQYLTLFLFLHHLVRKHLAAFQGDVQQVNALRQTLQADFVGVLDRLQQLAEGVEHLHFNGFLAFDADYACGGVV